MSERRASLTGPLREIAMVAGEEAALKIADKLGGVRVYFPAAPSPDHWLSQMVGHQAALDIGEQLTGGFAGGARIDLPSGPAGFQETQRQKVDRLIREGFSARDIALSTRYTDRGVRKRRAKIGATRDERQGKLFQD